MAAVLTKCEYFRTQDSGLRYDLFNVKSYKYKIYQVINTLNGHTFSERERSSQRQPCRIYRKQRGNLRRNRQRRHSDDLSAPVHTMVHFWPNTTRHVRRPPLRSCLTACEKATWRGERNMQDNINKLWTFVLNHHLLSSPYRDIPICIDNNIDNNKKYIKSLKIRWLKTYICHMQLCILLIVTNIALWIKVQP